MTYNSRHVDMLVCDISGKIGRTFLHVCWDPINKQYGIGLRVWNAGAVPTTETIYIDFETTSLLYQRLPEVVSILNKFNTHEIKPLQNYLGAYRLSQMALHQHDRKNWGACDFDPADL